MGQGHQDTCCCKLCIAVRVLYTFVARLLADDSNIDMTALMQPDRDPSCLACCLVFDIACLLHDIAASDLSVIFSDQLDISTCSTVDRMVCSYCVRSHPACPFVESIS